MAHGDPTADIVALLRRLPKCLARGPRYGSAGSSTSSLQRVSRARYPSSIASGSPMDHFSNSWFGSMWIQPSRHQGRGRCPGGCCRLRVRTFTHILENWIWPKRVHCGEPSKVPRQNQRQSLSLLARWISLRSLARGQSCAVGCSTSYHFCTKTPIGPFRKYAYKTGINTRRHYRTSQP